MAAIGVGIGYAALATFEAPGPLGAPAIVVVPRGGLAQVGAALKAARVIGSVRVFSVFAALTAWQGRLHAAELAFPEKASLAQVLLVLRSARPVQHKLTIVEGETASRIALGLAHADGLEGEIEVPAEGGALPETYVYERGESARAIMRRAGLSMQRVLAQEWSARAAEVGVPSAEAMLIVASLVERETHLASERAIVARVFYNRLFHGMRLQSDPTVIYADSGGDGVLARGLSRADLALATPYNTYVIPGLPAGPICSPGAASIDAAAHPARSDALYFVADGTGGHVFADTLDEHLRNVRRLRGLQQ